MAREHATRDLGSVREGRLALALAAVAGLRVLLFAAAFPFFTHVDEHRHVDAVLKYARGYLPRPGENAYEPEMARLLGVYGSPEYHLDPARPEVPPPAWRGGEMSRRIEAQQRFLAPRHNLEAYETPLYYAVAGGWLRIGRALGLAEGPQLYWVRALNALFAFLLVVATYRLLRDVYPEDRLVRLGVPALLAVFPQDALYYVTRDALSPLVAGLAFLLVARAARRAESGAAVFAGAGLLAAAAFLVKPTNLAPLAVAAACTLRALARGEGAREPIGRGGRWLLLWALALAPVAGWLVRNWIALGDPLGSGEKIARMGWQPKALGAMFDHPLFTPAGLAGFVGELIPSFWRGQLAWRRELLAHGGVDAFYTASSLLFAACACAGLRRRSDARGARFEEALALLALGVSVAALVALSLAFEFHETSDPPAHRPYFAHGRLVSGALVPFLLLYVRGIRVATAPFGRAGPPLAWGALAVAAGVATLSEIASSAPVFASPYNWFHLP